MTKGGVSARVGKATRLAASLARLTIAGNGPNTGKILTLKLFIAAKSPTLPLAYSSSGSGRSPISGRGFSVEYTTGMPDVIPSILSRRRTERASGSSNVVEKSLSGHEVRLAGLRLEGEGRVGLA